MGDTIVIETPVATVLEVSGKQGPQGVPGLKGDPGDIAGEIAWANITGKPSTFTPSSHTHVAADVTDFNAAVVAAAPPTTNASLLTSGTLPDARLSANIARTSDVTGAVAAVVNAAPASLDTLKELADALGNDANFASTVTNSLASKAPTSRTISAGTGLTGGGDLSADRTLAVSFGNTAGTVAQGNDSRLSDARQPLSHASSHHTGGTDAIAPNNISAAWALVLSNQTITGDTLLSAGRNRRITLFAVGATANVDLPHQNNQAGDSVTLVADFAVASTLTIRRASVMSGSSPVAYSTLATLNTSGQSFTFVSDGTATGWSLRSVDTHTHAASAIVSGTLAHERGGLEADVSAYSGLLKISGGSTSAVTVTSAGEALLDDADAAAQRTTLGLGTAATAATGDFAASSHSHGNLTSDGKVGSAAGLPVVTTTAGAVTTLALGTANQVLRVNSGATGVEFADPSGGGVSSVSSSASDVIGVSGANITGVDANADRLVFWDDSANKLTYLEAGSGLSISGTTLTASGGLNAMQSIAINFVLN